MLLLRVGRGGGKIGGLKLLGVLDLSVLWLVEDE